MIALLNPVRKIEKGTTGNIIEVEILNRDDVRYAIALNIKKGLKAEVLKPLILLESLPVIGIKGLVRTIR
ncbi:MAG: hypothetical protein N2645_05475 [Clostridia bacterium]|nr:hypothetical protein [Clostridia bacterium]